LSSKNYDGLSDSEPFRATGSFLYLINIEENKNVPIGLALDLPNEEDEHRFSFIKLDKVTR